MADTEETTSIRSQVWKHEAFVTWATEEGLLSGNESPAEVIAVFAAKRNQFRKSDVYSSTIEGHAAEAEAAKEARRVEREEAAAQRAAEREAAKAEKAAAKAAATPKETKATKATKAPAKATKARKASKATASDEDAFG